MNDDYPDLNITPAQRVRPRPRLQRGVVILPSALTLANLFAGLWAIVAASRGEFALAAWLIVAAAAADMLDGRVARATRTGSQFGEELDSLVDAISFGVAPALIVYHLFLTEGIWSWTASFIYVASAVVRLARFNIEQAGHAKVAFHGLPSPTAGMTLATFYPFSRTVFFEENLSHLVDWSIAITVLMILLGGLMMSHILYPVVPKFGIRSFKGLFTLLLMLGSIVAAFTIPSIFFFPMAMLYITYGIAKALVLGFIDRLPERDPLLDEEPGDEAGAELREIEYGETLDAESLEGRLPSDRRRGLGRRDQDREDF
ncbi:MAG TPA: CDP-diacylglycerol--serine O-phosphatidyltransferase [Longimicrobiales bacterium]|nr:CDP-diacylglycerol--serine O-phosphatidyltransferase [Longimicrobiales bacterium]